MSETYDYNKTPIDVEKLKMEIIANETIVKTLETIVYNSGGSPNTLHITFDLTLTAGEETALDTIVSSHDGVAATIYTIYCYDCGCSRSQATLSALTECPCCSGTDIQASYHNDNMDATTNPNASNDNTEGYCEGSKWINVDTEQVFICTDDATDSAKWSSISTIRKDIGWSSDKGADLVVVSGTHRTPIMFAGTPTSIIIKSIRAMIATAPTGAAIIIDINKNGTTIFTTQGNRPTIAISAFDSGEVTNMDITSLAKGDYLTLDIDQIGSSAAGKDLVVILEIEIVS